jgi:hypothetical protein
MKKKALLLLLLFLRLHDEEGTVAVLFVVFRSHEE